MIGKIMSGAAHSVIGMLSAGPSGMENNALTSDFGSLLRTPGQQHSRASTDEIDNDRFDLENLLGIDPALAQNRDTAIGLTFINHSIGKAIRESDISQKSDAKPNLDIEQNTELKDAAALGKAGQTLTGFESGILSPGNGISLGQASRIAPLTVAGTEQIVAGRALNDVRNAEGSLQPSTPRETDANVEIVQSGDKGLLKPQGQQSNLRGETDEQPLPAAKLSAIASLDVQAAPSSGQTVKPVSNDLAGVISQTASKEGVQKDRRSDLDRQGFRTVSPQQAPLTIASLRTQPIDSGKDVEPINLDLQPKKILDASLEQQLPAGPTGPISVREPAQKTVTFDMSAPQIAQRLATEIVDVSVTGEMKKFEINPRNLGRMEIIFTTRGSAEIIEIQTERPAARDVIMQHSQLLQDILKSQGRDDLTLRVDVKENMFASSRNDDANFSQHGNCDAREEQARPSQRRPTETLGGTVEDTEPSDNNRYA